MFIVLSDRRSSAKWNRCRAILHTQQWVLPDHVIDRGNLAFIFTGVLVADLQRLTFDDPGPSPSPPDVAMEVTTIGRYAAHDSWYLYYRDLGIAAVMARVTNALDAELEGPALPLQNSRKKRVLFDFPYIKLPQRLSAELLALQYFPDDLVLLLCKQCKKDMANGERI